jgi:prevent-host-death family protein
VFVFVNGLTSTQKGAVAEAAIARAAVDVGYVVLHPFTEGAPLHRDVIAVMARTSRHTPHGYVRTVYTREEIDALGVYCASLDRCYLIPVEKLNGGGSFHMRVAPARNHQRAGVNMASEYEFGAVAQLEERRHGMAEARGSSPLSSTPLPDDAALDEIEVGAHEFRNHFGYFMERAAAGQHIRVVRRGKPYVHLVGAQPSSR